MRKHFLITFIALLFATCSAAYAGIFDTIGEAISGGTVGIAGSIAGILSLAALIPTIRRIGILAMRIKGKILALWAKWYDKILEVLKTLSPEFIKDVQYLLYDIDAFLETVAKVLAVTPGLRHYAKDLRSVLTHSMIRRMSSIYAGERDALTRIELSKLVEENKIVREASKFLE